MDLPPPPNATESSLELIELLDSKSNNLLKENPSRLLHRTEYMDMRYITVPIESF